ncbi:RDD family protein [Nocardioides sp.]|uniref:RDD family protein n=1 Tax=Nocardioides sp. TaxID=35761 RepID=UPI003D0E4C1F
MAQNRAPAAYATWRQRVLATLTDAGLLLMVAVAVAIPVLAVPEPSVEIVIAVTTVVYLYWQFLNGSTGQSPGKSLVGLRVVSLRDDQPIGGWQGVARFGVAAVLAFFSCGLAALVDNLLPLRDGRRQTLHDKAVGSVVLAGQERRTLAELLRPVTRLMRPGR